MGGSGRCVRVPPKSATVTSHRSRRGSDARRGRSHARRQPDVGALGAARARWPRGDGGARPQPAASRWVAA